MAVAACVAAIVVGMVLFYPHEAGNDILPGEIAEGLLALDWMNIGGVESMDARPVGEGAVITATLHDGSRASYVLTRGAGEGTLMLIPMDELGEAKWE